MSNIHQLLQVLQARPRVDQQIDVLHELNSALTMASGHPSQNRVGGVIQALVPLLSGTNNEVVLLAIRALITCIDITPRTATSLVESGAVAPMCRRLLKIQDMDVAEACLKCLHLLSKDNPRAVLEAGGAKACLAFFDFFPMELQQNALDTVSRLVAPGVCGRRADIRRAREILPFLRECLQKQQAGGAVAGESSVGFHGGGIGAAGRSGGDVRRSSTASGRGTLRGKDGAGGVSQMASLCLERMVVSFSTPVENTTESWSVSRKLRRSRSNFSFRAPPRPCDRQRPRSLRVANENPAPGTSGTPSDPVGAPVVTEAAATADGSEPVGKRSKQKQAVKRGEGQKERDEEALTPGDVGDTPSPSFSSPSSPSPPGDGDGSGNGPKGESRPPVENKGEGVPIDEGGGAADGEEGETSAGAAAAAMSSSSVSKGKGKARASNVGASSSAPPLPAASGGGARNEEWSVVISSADGRVALGDQPADGGSMVDRAKERELESLVENARVMAVWSLMEMSPKGNRAACDEEGVPPAVNAVGFHAMEVDVDEGEAKGDAEKEVVKTDDVGDGGCRRASAGAENSYDNASASATAAPAAGACAGAGIPAPAAVAPAPPVKAAGTQPSRKAPVAAPRGGEKKEQGRLAGGLKAWQVTFVLEIAEGGVLSAWSRTLEDSVKALIGGASGDLAPGWRLQSRLLSTIARVVSAAPVAVQALFDVGMPRLLRRILADYVCCDLVTVEGASGIGSTNSGGRWKPSPLADSRIGEERLLAALGLATAMLPPPSGKTEDSKVSSSRRGKGPTAATLEGKPGSIDVDESPDGCEEAGRRALEGFGEDSVTGEKRKYSDDDGGDCTDDNEGLPPELEQAAAAAAAAAAGKRRVKCGGDYIGRGHFGARDADETGAQSKESAFEASSRDATSGGDDGVEETKEAAQGMSERSPAAATTTADGTGGPSENVNRGAGGPDGDALNPATEPRTAAKTNSSISSPSLLPAIGGSEVEEEHRQRMTGVEGPTANTAAPRHHAREENNGDGVSANGDPAETAQAQARARRAAEDASKAAAADAAAAASAARAAREAAAAAAAAASGAEWACSACTFINHGSGFGRVCEVCGTPNASAVAAVTAGGAGGFFGGGALEARLQALRFRGGRGVGSSGGGVSIWESDAMGVEDEEGDDDSGIPGFPPHWHRGVGAERDDGNPETAYLRNQAEVAEENHEDEDDKDSEMFAPDGKVFVRLRHVYGQDEGLFQEFSLELLAPLLRLVPSGLSSPKAVRLAAAALVSLRQHSVECLLRKECADELAAALYRLLSKREDALRTGALAVAEAVLQSRSPVELGEACISGGKSAGIAGGGEMKSSPPSSASTTGGVAYYREVFARHGVLKLVEGSRDEHPSPAFDAEVLRAPLTSSSSSGSPRPLHPTLVNLREIAARLYLSSPPDPRRLDCGDQNNGDRHGGGRLPRATKDEGMAASPAGEQSTSKGKGKGKGKAVCPPGGEREETGGGYSCVPSGLSLIGVLRDGPGPNKFTAWDAPVKENGVVGSKDGNGSDISLAFSDLTRALKGHLGGVTTFEAEESGVLRALLRALLNGAHGNDVSAGALAAGEESAESLPEGDRAPWRKETHVAPSGGVHRKGDGENSPSSFDNGLAPMEAEPVGAAEFTEGCGFASRATPSGSIVTPGAASIKRELDNPDEAPLFPVAALQSSPSRPRGEADSTMVAATDGDVRGGSAASSSGVFGGRGAAVGTWLTGSDFFLEVGKALLTPDEDGRLPMESLISMTQGCLQALTDDVMVVNHGGDTEAAHYRSLVRPFTVLLSPGPSPPRASPPAPENYASSHSSEPRPGSAAGVKDEILSPLSGSAAGGDAGDAEEVPNATPPDNAGAAAAASTGGWTRGSSMDGDSGVSTAGEGRDPNACAAVAETRTRGTTKQECDSAPQQQPSSSLGVSTSALAVRAGERGKGGRREAAMAEKMEAQAGLLRSLSVGLHPVLLVEPLTTVEEVIKWYTVQLEKAFKLHKRRRRQERQRAAEEEAQDLASPNREVPLLTTSEGSPIRHESQVTTPGKASATAADTGSGPITRKRTMPDRAAKRKSGMAQGGGLKTVRGGRKTRVSRRNSTSSLSSSVSGHAGRGSVLMAAQESKGEATEIALAVSRATDAAAAGDGDRAAASTAALSSVSQRAVKRRRASSPRAEAEAASGEGGEGGGEGASSTPRSGRWPASSRSSSRSRVNKNTAAAGKTALEEGSNTRLRQRRKVEGGSSSSGVLMAAESSAAPSPAPGSRQGSVSGLGKKGSAAVRGGGVESGEGNSAGGMPKPEPTRLRPGREVFCCFRTSQGEDRSGMWYRGTVDVHHRDGTLDVRFDDGDLRENIPRSHVTITLPSVVQVHREKRPWRNLWSPEQQQATPAATSTVFPSSGAGGPSAAAEATATAMSTVADGSTGGRGVDGDHAQERPGTVDTLSQSSMRPAAEESREEMHRAAAASSTEAAASSSGTRSTKEAEAPSTGPPPVSSSRRGAGGPSSRSVDTATAIELEFARLRHARSMQDTRNAVGGFGVGLGGGFGERGGHGGGTSALATSTTLRMTIPGMVDEDSPAGPGVRIQLMSTRRDLAPGPSSAPRSLSSAARQGPGASESRSSGTPGEGGSSRSIGGGVEEKEGASHGQRGVSPTRGQPGANSGGGVEGGVAPLGKGQQQSKERGRGGASSPPSMPESGSGLRLASASPSVASTRSETAADAPSAAAEATSTATEGRPVTRQSSAASSAGGGGSSSSEPTAAATPGRRSSRRKRSTGGNAGGSGVAGDSGAADASAGAGAAVDGRVLRRASTRSGASTTKSPREPPVYFDRSVTTDKYGGPPFAIKGWVSTKHPDGEDGAGGHPQSGTNSSSNSRSRSTTGRKTRASAAAAAAAEAAQVAGAEAEPISPKRRSSPARGSGWGGESAWRSRDSVRFPRLEWTLRYDWNAASAANVDVTRGDIPNGATMFEAVQLLMFKHSQETEGDVPRTSNWDLFKHRSMRVPLEQWGKSITLEFSPRRPKSSPIPQVEGVSGAGAGSRQSVARREEEPASAAPTASSSISPLPTAEMPTTMETQTRGSSNGVGKKNKNEKESRSRPFKVRKGAGMEGSSNSSGGANASASGGVQVFELPPVLTPGATPLDARLASLRALLEGGGIGAGLRFGEHMCLLAALQAFCEEWGPLRKRLALKGRVDDDVPDPHPSVLHDLAKRCVVAGLQRKVSRQACNPLALCSGSLPSWCIRLPAEFPTLFSLETRLALYKKTSLGMARAVAHVQQKAKNVEDQPQGSSLGSSESPNDMMAGIAGRGGGLLGHGGPDAPATPLPELLRQLGRLGRLTVLLSRDSILEMATFLFGLLVNGQKQPPHQRSIHPPTSSGPEAGSSGNRQRSGRASAPGRLRRGGGVVGGAATRVRGFGGGGSGLSGRLGYGDFDVSNDDDDDDYVSGDDEEDYNGEEKAMTHEGNSEGGDGSGDVAEMELDEGALSDAEEPDPGQRHGLPQQHQQHQPPLPSEAGDGNAGRGGDRRVVTVEASVPPPHAGRQAENLADMESMLLVEFAGETGHGTGPTLEFYSLVCRELIRKGLGMWRGDNVSRSPPQGAANSSTVSGGQKEGSETSPTLEGLDDSEVGKSEGKGSATRGVDGGDGPGAFSQQDDMAVEEDDPFLQVGPEGLFPAPLDVRNRRLCASVEARFRLLGRVMGKALKDGRMLDLPLALPLCSLIVGLRRHDGTSSSAGGSPGGGNGGQGRSTAVGSGGLGGIAKPLTLVDVGLVDAALGRSLESVAELAEEVQRAKAFEEMKHAGRHLSGPGDPETLPSPPPRSISELEACAGALCLSWSLPGCPWYELRPGGANADVAASDLAVWVDEVTRVFLVDSVVTQVEALVKGVSEVIDPSKLSLLTAGELQRLVGGEAAGGADGDLEWDYHRIMGSLVCRHGYSVESAQVKWLAQVMASLDPAGRRQFLRFVTGTPRLPIGGFAALRPRLTVVKKEVGGKLGGSPDAHLPSCSTCQVYLKLPAYTSKNALETKLLQAITEGQDHFALD